jgi:hypothetical protein
MRTDRRRTVALAALGLTLLTSACGVTESSGPTDHGDAAVAGSVGAGTVQEPPDASTAAGAGDLVAKYFYAATGAVNDHDAALARVRKFFLESALTGWNESNEVTVVRVITIGTPRNEGRTYRVPVRYVAVGVLNEDGGIDLLNDRRVREVSFKAQRPDAAVGWRLTAAPNGLMISDVALTRYHLVTPVYFWDHSRQTLVPDLRYLPLNMPPQKRPDQVVDWLLAGPSPGLRSAVWQYPNPSAVTKKAPVVIGDGGQVVVNLSGGALAKDGPSEGQLMDQLRWSLLAILTGPVELQIEGQRKEVDGASNRFHDAYPAGQPATGKLFGVNRETGKVVLVAGRRPSTAPGPTVLNVDANAGVGYAAISLDHRLAAFVRGGRLTVVRINDRDPNKPRVANVAGLPRGDVGRPVWIPRSDDLLLVPVAGRLYVVDREDDAHPVRAGGLDGVTSVSVAPDGRRVAFAARGRAYVAALKVDGATVSMEDSGRRQLVPHLLAVAAVAWDSDTRLLLAGAAGDRVALFRTTADGAVAQDVYPEETDGGLTDVVAFADRVLGGGGDVVARIGNDAFYVYPEKTVDPDPIEVRVPFYAGP